MLPSSIYLTICTQLPDKKRFSTIYTLAQVILFFIFAFVAWTLWQNVGARERAMELAKQRCESLQVQLLDETVSLIKMRPKRHTRGYLSWQRVYEFEFTVTGDRRYLGELSLVGNQPTSIQLQPHRVQ